MHINVNCPKQCSAVTALHCTCCNFKGFKVISLQSSARQRFEPRPPAGVNFPMLRDSRWCLGSNLDQAKLWRLVALKPLKLQQCTLHFWKPQIFFYLDKRGQERNCMFSLWYAIVKLIGLLHNIANGCILTLESVCGIC